MSVKPLLLIGKSINGSTTSINNRLRLIRQDSRYEYLLDQEEYDPPLMMDLLSELPDKIYLNKLPLYKDGYLVDLYRL